MQLAAPEYTQNQRKQLGSLFNLGHGLIFGAVNCTNTCFRSIDPENRNCSPDLSHSIDCYYPSLRLHTVIQNVNQICIPSVVFVEEECDEFEFILLLGYRERVHSIENK